MRKLGKLNSFPRGKFQDDDEGAIQIAISVRDKTLVIDFGTSVTWVGMPKQNAIDFANVILKRAQEMP